MGICFATVFQAYQRTTLPWSLLCIRWSVVGEQYWKTVSCCYRIRPFFQLNCYILYLRKPLELIKSSVNKPRHRFTATSLHVSSSKKREATLSLPCMYLRVFMVSNAGQRNIRHSDFFWMRSFWSKVSFPPSTDTYMLSSELGHYIPDKIITFPVLSISSIFCFKSASGGQPHSLHNSWQIPWVPAKMLLCNWFLLCFGVTSAPELPT